MPFPNVTLPSVWDIPVAVGVPALLGQSIGAGASASASTALAGVVQSWAIEQTAKKWGIFNSSNANVLSAAHVHGVEYETSYAIANAPLEDGAFVSYNKVKAPFNARVTLLCDGSETGSSSIVSQIQKMFSLANDTSGNGQIMSQISSAISGQPSADLAVRQSFIASLEALVADTNLYSVVTPERTYINANIVGYRLRRSPEAGINLVMAEVAIQEVQRRASAGYTNTRTPQGSQTVQNGTVQTTTPSLPVQTSLLGVTL